MRFKLVGCIQGGQTQWSGVGMGSFQKALSVARCQANDATNGALVATAASGRRKTAAGTSWQILYGAGPMFANELLREAISRPSFSKLSDCHALGLGAAVIVLGSSRPGEPRCGC